MVRFSLYFLFFLNSAHIFGQRFEISSTGLQTSKLNIFKADEKSLLALNNHASVYTDINPYIYFDSLSFLSACLNLSNDEFSYHRSPEATWMFLLKLDNGFHKDKIIKNYRLTVGELPKHTVGSGLSFKDMRMVGFHGGLDILNFAVDATIWAQGFQQDEDIVFFELRHREFPIQINSFFWIQMHNEVLLQYILPNYEQQFGPFSMYLELGILALEIMEFESRKSYSSIFDYPYAGLFGFKLQTTLKKTDIFINVEAKYYKKGFIKGPIPNNKQLTGLYHYFHSSNNWIDFQYFLSNSLVTFFKMELKYPISKTVKLFSGSELILIHSNQKAAFQHNSSNQLKIFSPSRFYYNLGIIYEYNTQLHLDILLSNRLISQENVVDNFGIDNQGSRFFHSELPFIELRVIWDI